MKVLFLNAWDSEGGAARAARRLLDGVRQIGVDARMLVQKKTGADDFVLGPRSRLDRAMAYLRPILEYYRIRRYPRWNGMSFSLGAFPDRLRGQLKPLDPDIVHLHWVGDGFLKIESLPRFQRPLVWTLHDSWAFTGGCHLPFDCVGYRQCCGVCPVLGSSRPLDLSRKIWLRKKKAWSNLGLTVVTPSHWLANCARSSALLGEARIEVIPNGLDLHRYRPVDKRIARQALALPQDRKLILFGGIRGTTDRNKGFHLLEGALRILADKEGHQKTELLVFGVQQPANPPNLGLKANYLGLLHDDISISLLYAAADVFLSPSLQENLPNTIMEAMACGTPCVAFNQGGVSDLIEHESNGYLAIPHDEIDLARGIAWVLEEDRHASLCHESRLKVENTFSLDKIAKIYSSLYQEILMGSGNGAFHAQRRTNMAC